jgi:hypothetical protein
VSHFLYYGAFSLKLLNIVQNRCQKSLCFCPICRNDLQIIVLHGFNALYQSPASQTSSPSSTRTHRSLAHRAPERSLSGYSNRVVYRILKPLKLAHRIVFKRSLGG